MSQSKSEVDIFVKGTSRKGVLVFVFPGSVMIVTIKDGWPQATGVYTSEEVEGLYASLGRILESKESRNMLRLAPLPNPEEPYIAGQRIICGYCKQNFYLNPDRRLPVHENPKKKPPHNICAGSTMKLDIMPASSPESETQDPQTEEAESNQSSLPSRESIS